MMKLGFQTHENTRATIAIVLHAIGTMVAAAKKKYLPVEVGLDTTALFEDELHDWSICNSKLRLSLAAIESRPQSVIIIRQNV